MNTFLKATAVVMMGALGACTTTGGSGDLVPTDMFIENTLQQYGVGPAGRTSQPDAVVVDEDGEDGTTMVPVS